MTPIQRLAKVILTADPKDVEDVAQDDDFDLILLEMAKERHDPLVRIAIERLTPKKRIHNEASCTKRN